VCGKASRSQDEAQPDQQRREIEFEQAHVGTIALAANVVH